MNRSIKYFKIILILMVIYHNNIFSHAVSSEARLIKKNEIWSGNISIMDDTIVEENSLLTIKPGTKVFFFVARDDTPPRLIIKGRLKIDGNEKQKVFLTSSDELLANPLDEDNSLFKKFINFIAKKKTGKNKIWGGIHFLNIEAKTSSINFCIIEFAKDGIVCNNSSPIINNVIIKNCKESGIRCNLKSNPEITNSVFENNGINGIYCHQESTPDIVSNIFQNQGAGIFCYQSAPNIIRNNNFKNNEKGIFCQFPSSSPIIIENKFINNKIGISCEQIASPKIQSNYFENNSKAIYLQRLSNPLIEKNEFIKNEFGIYCFQNSSPVITQNKFNFNQCGIFLHYASYPIIKENSFYEDNVYAIKVGKQSSMLYKKLMANTPTRNRLKIGRGAYAPKNLGKNFNKYNTVQLEDFTGVEPTINAHGNYWGKKVNEEIKSNGENINLSSIWDGYDEPVFEFEGAKYPQDKVDYSGWIK